MWNPFRKQARPPVNIVIEVSQHQGVVFTCSDRVNVLFVENISGDDFASEPCHFNLLSEHCVTGFGDEKRLDDAEYTRWRNETVDVRRRPHWNKVYGDKT